MLEEGRLAAMAVGRSSCMDDRVRDGGDKIHLLRLMTSEQAHARVVWSGVVVPPACFILYTVFDEYTSLLHYYYHSWGAKSNTLFRDPFVLARLNSSPVQHVRWVL